MGKIVDVSHHQGVIDWAKASKELDLAIIRVQYGSKTIDRKYKDNIAGAKKYGVPFGHYAYGHYVSVADAIKEAKDFLARIDKDAKFLALDVEGDTLESCGPTNLAAASQAFIDTCKAAGYKTGVYISHHLYNKYGLNKLKADFLWIPRYPSKDVGLPNGPKPDMPCCLWQYTQCGKLAGVAGNVDINQLTGDKTLEWFIGKAEAKEVAQPAASIPVKSVEKSELIGRKLTIKTDKLWYYNTPRWDVKGGEGSTGDKFFITEELTVNGARMVKCHDGKYRTADPAHVDISPKPSDWPYRVVIDGITHAQAAEIVNEIHAKYKNAKAEGQAK